MSIAFRSKFRNAIATLLGIQPTPTSSPATERFERRYRALVSSPPGSPVDGNAADGFVVQGPITPDTERVLRALRQIYPAEVIVLSTWNDSCPDLHSVLGLFCNAVVTSPRPEPAGGSNRNLQIASTLAGIRRAQTLGASTLLKMRTDTCLLAPNVFDLYRAIQAQTDLHSCISSGLRGRIFVPQTYTKKYFPYHVSDIIMLGHTADLLNYWDVPLDTRQMSPESFSWERQPLEKIGHQGLLPECYFGKRYADRLIPSSTSTDSLTQYWNFLRDYFVVLDDSWFDFYWFKRPDYLQPLAVDEVVSHHFWLSLYFGCNPRADLLQLDLADARREGATFAYDSSCKI